MYDSIAAEFRSAILAGGLLEPSNYYRVQERCSVALSSAASNACVPLLCATKLAQALAEALEDGGIDAGVVENWHVYSDALERVIRLADSTLNGQEIMWQLAACIKKIWPPMTGITP
jgi:hypothetical protein